MKIPKYATACALAATLLAGHWDGAQAAVVTLFGDRTDFVTALGGAPTVTQDFEGYAVGTNLMGVDVLPQVTLSTNLSSLAVFNSASYGNVAFATSRNLPEAIYDINFSGSTTAFGFDIAAFNPATPGPGFLSFYFADGDLTYTLIPVIPTNATEQIALFFGVISDVPLVRITWSEGPELDGFSCCEETAIDNMIMRGSNTVPEPGTWGMALLGLAGAGWHSRRRRVD
jgi:MYXO-CTERM domain-containing protein